MNDGLKSVGVGVVVWLMRDGKVLLGKRLSEHGKGTWGLPGGKMDHGETMEKCVIRETLEETGLKIKNPEFVAVTNDLFDTGKHYITIFMKAQCPKGEPKIMEPDKLEKWQWFNIGKLPSPLFLPIINLQKQGFTL